MMVNLKLVAALVILKPSQTHAMYHDALTDLWYKGSFNLTKLFVSVPLRFSFKDFVLLPFLFILSVFVLAVSLSKYKYF